MHGGRTDHAGRRALQRLLIAVAALAGMRAASAAALSGLDADARTILGAGQGVYVETSDGTVLVAQAAAKAVHPASVSKVATSLALLERLGPDHRFTTRFAWNGSVIDGTLEGDLTVRADGDPSLVDEDALLIAARLNALGIRRIDGALRPATPLTFDWQPDNDGGRLQLALTGRTPEAAWVTVEKAEAVQLGERTAGVRPAVVFLPASWSAAHIAPAALTTSPGGRELIYQSPLLISVLKSLNDYSNNIVKALADTVGGAGEVQAIARSHVPASMRDEIVLGDGAGEDPRNRMSPRAAVRLLRALESELASTGHTLCDVLPVAGVDAGTLEARLTGPAEAGRVVGKTGTFGSYGASALVGAISTRDRGTVYFAILDHGVPVAQARRRQDRFVRVLLAHLESTPWPYHPDGLPAVARATIEVGGR